MFKVINQEQEKFVKSFKTRQEAEAYISEQFNPTYELFDREYPVYIIASPSPSIEETDMDFNQDALNDRLHKEHPMLSSNWSFMDWNNEKATITYQFDDGSDDEVFIYKDGTIYVSDKVIYEMNMDLIKQVSYR